MTTTVSSRPSRAPKAVRRFFALLQDPTNPEGNTYLSVIGPFKNRTACEWHLENMDGDKEGTWKIQEVIKI